MSKVGQKAVVSAKAGVVVAEEIKRGKTVYTIQMEDGSTRKTPVGFVEFDEDFEFKAPDWSGRSLTAAEVVAKKSRY